MTEALNGNAGKREMGGGLIPLISGVGDVCDVGALSSLPSKNNIGIGRLWCEKWGESRGGGNYSRPISMHPAFIKYSHRKLGPRSNASGQVPDRQPASLPASPAKYLDMQTATKTGRGNLFIHPAIHPLRPEVHR